MIQRILLATAVTTALCFSQTLPGTEVTTLTGLSVTIPKAGAKKPLLLLLSFTSKGSSDVTAWNKQFKTSYESDPRVDYYELADFQGVPSFVMKMILHGMRRSVKEPERSHFAPFFTAEDQWKELVHFQDPKIGYVVLADANGSVLWQTQGPASSNKATELEAVISNSAKP